MTPKASTPEARTKSSEDGQAERQRLDALFDSWWEADGRFIDPDTDDVPWFDKRRGLAAAAFFAGLKPAPSSSAAIAVAKPLPCKCYAEEDGRPLHNLHCPAHYRPIVEALITRERDAAVEQERERCAKVAENTYQMTVDNWHKRGIAYHVAAAIRSTSPQDGKDST